MQATSYDCSWCKFTNDDDSACVDYGLDWELGWNWYQEQEDDVLYRMRLELYTEQAATIHPLFSMPRFYYNEQTWKVDTFKAKFNVDFVFHYEYNYFCINLFYSYDDLDIELKMHMKMQECLKDVIECLFNLDNWTSIDAKWYGECSQSSQEYITMYELTIDEATTYI